MYRLTRLSLTYPKTTLLAVALITAVLGVGLTRLRTEFGYRVLVGDDHPSIQTLDAFIEQFGGGLPVQIGWECGEGHPCDSVFDHASMEMANAVTRALASVAGIQDVQSPANAPLLVPDVNGFAVRRLVENGELVSDAAVLASRALDDPLWVGAVVSADGMAAAIIVQPTDTTSETNVRVTDAIEETLLPYEARGFEFYLVGDPVANVLSGRDLAESSAKLIPFTILLVVVILLALSGSWQTAAVTVGSMGIALVWTFGMLGWLDWPQDGVLEVLAPLILVVGVCDAIHLLSRYAAEVDSSGTVDSVEKRGQALLGVTRDVGPACLITTLTTAGAFFSFVTSPLDTFVRFGIISAFGVVACLTLTFSLLPVLARALPGTGGRSVRTSEAWDSGLRAIMRTSEERAGAILASIAFLFMICVFGWASHLRVDTDWYESFGEKSRVIRSIRFMVKHFGQSEALELEIGLPAGVSLEDPETLKTISDFSEFLSSTEGLGSTSSVLDHVKQINRLLHADDPAFERLGETRAANAEILELIAFEDAGVLSTWVSLDRTRFRLSVEAPEQSYSTRRSVLDSVREYVDSELPPGWSVVLTGESAMGFDWIKDVQGTQVRSFPTALVLVLLMVALFLRSIRLALAAMVPTLLPVVVTLGTMGWADMGLDVGRAMIAAVLIGIAIDDSVHLLHQYQRRRVAGENPREAIRGAVLHVGRAVVTTSLALSLGFLTLMASAWQTIASFGFFVSLAILGALVATLFVLPALFFVAKPVPEWRRASKESSGRAAAEYHRSGPSCTD